MNTEQERAAVEADRKRRGEPDYFISACYFPKAGEVELSWERKEDGAKATLTCKVTPEQGSKIANVVWPCVYYTASPQPAEPDDMPPLDDRATYPARQVRRLIRKDRARRAAPVTQEPIAYLDVGRDGYLDLGSDKSDDELMALPQGRHMLGIIGTYGEDGQYRVANVAHVAQEPVIPTEVRETIQRALVAFQDGQLERQRALQAPEKKGVSIYGAARIAAQRNMNDADAALNWLAAPVTAQAQPTVKDGLTVAVQSSVQNLEDVDLTSKDEYRNMFHAACADLGAINEALGLDPDDGGAGPILAAIEQLRAAKEKA